MCSVQESMKSKDDFTVYGENVASRMRLANKNPMAIAMAKNRIDNILFQLEMDQLSGRQTEIYTAPSTWQHKNYSWQSSPTPSFSSSLYSPSPPSASINSTYSNSQYQSIQSPLQYTNLEAAHYDEQLSIPIQESQGFSAPKSNIE